MRDYWRHCGYLLLARSAQGQLLVTDDFLRSLLERPELAPVPESGPGELAVRELLLRDPRADVPPALLDAVADEDARSNYEVWLRFRDRLLAGPTLEASYLALFRGDGVDVPPMFVHQLTQILLRHCLGADAGPAQARAAEMLFRPQRIAIDEGRVMAADEETVERHALSPEFGAIGDLLRQAGAPVRAAQLDVLGADNADAYWDRDEAHDFAICLNHGEPMLAALCEVLERWVSHFIGTNVRIQPEREIDEEQWVWHAGLDAQASAILNDLYRGEDVSDERMAGLLCLFRLHFEDPAAMRAEVAGRPVYLAMAMDSARRLKLKPQNLLLNLPLARSA